MLITTMNELPNTRIIEILGVVRGNTVRARHLGNDILASFRGVVGGEIKEYTKLLAEAREQSQDRMISQAKQLGANAIIGIRFTTSTVAQGSAEILVYGTAVKIAERHRHLHF